MLIWIFGSLKSVNVETKDAYHASGTLELERARVKWFLSIRYEHVPEKFRLAGKRTYRSLTLEGEELEFSEGFTDLHTKSYEEILKGNGFGLEEAKASIDLVHAIRK
jgi:UDP-N-acetyl-2-amino-2-deoxyglucuronate dehydrogenase